MGEGRCQRPHRHIVKAPWPLSGFLSSHSYLFCPNDIRPLSLPGSGKHVHQALPGPLGPVTLRLIFTRGLVTSAVLLSKGTRWGAGCSLSEKMNIYFFTAKTMKSPLTQKDQLNRARGVVHPADTFLGTSERVQGWPQQW